MLDNTTNKIIETTFINLNDKKIKLFITSDYYIPIYKTEYIKYFDNESIARDKLLELRAKVVTRAKKRVFYLLANREYTVYEIRSKLRRGGYHTSDIDIIIDYFIQLGYLDDEAYAQKYFDYYKDKKSLRQIREKLRTKGIAREIIDSLFEDSEDLKDIQFDLAYKLALDKTRKISSDKFREKLYKYLASKGYSYLIITKVIEKITLEEKEYIA